jgi:uncharacterized protein YjiS (DUF1127 family)
MTIQSFLPPQGLSPHVSLSENAFAKPQRDRWRGQHISGTLREWRRRMSSRRELAALSAFDLKDIGYPPRAEAEKAKPFWRA